MPYRWQDQGYEDFNEGADVVVPDWQQAMMADAGLDWQPAPYVPPAVDPLALQVGTENFQEGAGVIDPIRAAMIADAGLDFPAPYVPPAVDPLALQVGTEDFQEGAYLEPVGIIQTPSYFQAADAELDLPPPVVPIPETVRADPRVTVSIPDPGPVTGPAPVEQRPYPDGRLPGGAQEPETVIDYGADPLGLQGSTEDFAEGSDVVVPSRVPVWAWVGGGLVAAVLAVRGLR